MEKWKMIENASHYYVSDEGRVKSTDQYDAKGRLHRGKMLHGVDNGKGYRKILVVFDDGTTQRIYIHRLVASAFIENTEGKPCVNHKDNDPTNNKASNLEWCTHQENMDWSNMQGRNKRTAIWIERLNKSLDFMKKPVIAVNKETGEMMRFPSVNSTALKGFYPPSVSQCCNGIRHSHAGYKWRFDDV